MRSGLTTQLLALALPGCQPQADTAVSPSLGSPLETLSVEEAAALAFLSYLPSEQGQ